MPARVIVKRYCKKGGVLHSIENSLFLPANTLADHWHIYHKYQTRQFFYWWDKNLRYDVKKHPRGFGQ
ncbi:hypothetical protein Pan54_36170 [Rubinisphaera italica]|uniref:Uncharacterized protein n=1 Tax=Rubinisphaera italica TaxID=2527969 RepID=A0A5C5XKC1_9PLAN|nr:hypothetical protein Pan54_36170 [Rubinisphaera italica]